MSVTPAIYNFSDPAVQADPYPIYERLRRESQTAVLTIVRRCRDLQLVHDRVD